MVHGKTRDVVRTIAYVVRGQQQGGCSKKKETGEGSPEKI